MHNGSRAVVDSILSTTALDMGVNDFCDLLTEKGVHSDVVASFSRNRICGVTFLTFSEDDLKELLPVIGGRVTVRNLLLEVRKVCCVIILSGPCYVYYVCPVISHL